MGVHMPVQRGTPNLQTCFARASPTDQDLKRMCKKYSSVDRREENEVLFHLHKENF